MGKGPSIPPALAGVAIVIVVLVAAVAFWRVAGPRGHVQINQDMAQKMMHPTGGGSPTSTNPMARGTGHS